MVHVVFFIAALLLVAGLFCPLMSWPKWAARVSVAPAVVVVISEIIQPDPALSVRFGKAVIVLGVAVFWLLPAIGYAIGRFLRWVIGLRKHRLREAYWVSVIATLMLFSSAPAAAQSEQQGSLAITCSSGIPAARYFCRQYRIRQEATWNKRDKQAEDKAEFNLRLDQFVKNKVVVGLTVTLGGVRREGTLIVAIDNRHLNASAAKVVEDTTAALDRWAKR